MGSVSADRSPGGPRVALPSAADLGRRGRPMGAVVYEAIRDAIVEGRIAADEQLVQEQLAAELGVSRTPVRDALNRLSHEGLVRAVLGRGYQVIDLTDQDINDVFVVRERLEMLAVEQSAGRLTALHQARARPLIEEMRATDPADAVAQYELNRRFHQTIIEPCNNAILLGLLDQLWDLPVSRRITKSYLRDAANVAHMVDEHDAILAAAAEGDLPRLLDLSRAHLTLGYGEARADSQPPT